MKSSKLVSLACALLALAAACSSRSVPSGTVTTPGRSTSPTTTGPPTAVSLNASLEPWKLSAAVSRPVVLPDRRGFVVLGGLETGDSSTSRIVRVNPSNGRSRIAGNLALAVHDSAGAVIGHHFFVFGGGSVATVSIVQAWKPNSAKEVAKLPVGRSDLSAATLDGTTYIVGGWNGSAISPAVLATRNGLHFKRVAHLSIGVRYAAVAGIGSTLWVVGGVTSTSEGGITDTNAVQKVNLISGRVTVVGRLPKPMGHATALVLDGQIFVLGGRSGTVPSSAIFRLDQSTGAVVRAGHLPRAVSDAGSVVVDGVGYLVGGEVTGPAEPLDTVVTLRPSLSH